MRKSIKTIILSSVSIACLSVVISSTAQAARYYTKGEADVHVKDVKDNFNQKLSAMQLAIIEAMRLSTGQSTSVARESTGAQHNLADQVDDRKVVQSVEDRRYEALIGAESTEYACNYFSTSGGGTSMGSAKVIGQALSKELGDWIGGNNNISKKGPQFALATRVKAHCKYAKQEDVDVGLCEKVGAVDYSDQSAALSLFKTQGGGMVHAYDEEAFEATKQLIVNSFTPVPVNNITEAEAETPGGLIKKANQITYVARNSIATSIVNDFASDKAVTITDPSVIEYMNAAAADIQGYENADFSNGASKLDWLAINAHRFSSPSALIASEKNDVVALKDLKNMTATMATLNFENYQELRKINVSLALIASILNDNNRGQFEGR